MERNDLRLIRQRTVRQEVSYTGPAIHTGTVSTVTLRPAQGDTGILFRRIDLPGQPTVQAIAENVSRADRCTTLQQGEAVISTVEHLMAALRGIGIDDVEIDVDGPEIPIGDGSAACFVKMIQEAGIVELDAPRRVVKVERPVWVRVGDKVAVALPYDGFKVSFTFTNDHNHPVLGDLFAEFDIDSETFCEEIANARTIGWLSELEALRARGLARGATAEMAVVLSENELLTPLRYPNEPARHKILDIIGDLYLSGYLEAHIIAIRTGHKINNQLARAIRAQHKALERV